MEFGTLTADCWTVVEGELVARAVGVVAQGDVC